MPNNRKRKCLFFAGLIAILAAVLVLGGLSARKMPVPADGHTITITVEVIHADGESRSFEIADNGGYLGPALLEAGLVQGERQQYGLYIVSADGETAKEEQEQWWCITKEGEPVLTGADATPIADGEHYELTLKTGWQQ